MVGQNQGIRLRSMHLSMHLTQQNSHSGQSPKRAGSSHALCANVSHILIYARHNLSVPTFKLAALEEQGELGFSHPLLITQNKFILTDIPLGTRKAERSAKLVD